MTKSNQGKICFASKQYEKLCGENFATTFGKTAHACAIECTNSLQCHRAVWEEENVVDGKSVGSCTFGSKTTCSAGDKQETDGDTEQIEAGVTVATIVTKNRIMIKCLGKNKCDQNIFTLPAYSS